MMHEGIVRAHGDGDLIASATLQDGMSVFETSYGAWAFRTTRGIDVTLGGPLCAPADRRDMIRRFLARSPKPIFCYLRRDTVEAIDDAPLFCAGMGIDRHVDIDQLLAAPSREVVGALKRARKAGLALEPIELAGLDPRTRRRIEEITTRYLADAECTVEMQFINRPMSFVPDGLRRVFLLTTPHTAAFGYVVLNPIFERGEIASYLLDIVRFERTPIWGVWLSVVSMLAERMKREGLGLSLGYSPLHEVALAPRLRSRWLDAEVALMSRVFSEAQYVRRLQELKAAIPGPREPRFFASFTRSAIRTFLALMEVSGVRPGYLLGPDLLLVLRRGMART